MFGNPSSQIAYLTAYYIVIPWVAYRFLQDKFVDYCQKIETKKNMKKNVVDEGWYTREEMVRVLHWNPNFSFNV